MALELTWQSQVNVVSDVTDPNKWAVWALKAGLCGQLGPNIFSDLYTVVASSDGVTKASSDLWLSTFDPTKLVNANPGTAHSWIVLQSAGAIIGGPYYLLLDYRYGSSSRNVRIVFSKSAFNTGAATIDNAPADTGDAMVFETDTLNSGSSGITLCKDSDISLRIHVRKSNRGDFHINYSHVGDSRFYSQISLTQLQDYQASDTNPIVCFAIGGDYLTNTAQGDGLKAIGTGSGGPGVANVCTISGTYSLLKCPTLPYADISSLKAAAAYQTFTGSNNAVAEEISYNTDSSLMAGRLVVYSIIPGPVVNNYRGRFADIFTAPINAAAAIPMLQGDLTPATSPYEYVKIGDFLWPWNSASIPAI